MVIRVTQNAMHLLHPNGFRYRSKIYGNALSIKVEQNAPLNIAMQKTVS